MLALRIDFLTGRYHATPWDRQVNEGTVEWPPSPWRLARALVATWHRKSHQDVPLEHVLQLVAALSESGPHYSLPAAVAAHTRHYMPVQGEATTLVFDTFLHLAPEEPLWMWWPELALSPDLLAALDTLCERVGYMGRAESWARLTRVPPEALPPQGLRASAWPLGPIEPLEGPWERVKLLAPTTPEQYRAFRERALEQQTSTALETRRQAGKKVALGPSEQKAMHATLPPDYLQALALETGELKSRGWHMPPAAHWVEYARPRLDDGGQVADARAQRPRAQGALPTLARLAIASQVSPRMTQALSVGERVRVALMSHSDAHPVFAGRTQDGTRLGEHRHAHIFCEALGPSDRITHIGLWAPMGFDQEAQAALGSLRKVWGHGGHDIQLILTGLGHPEDFAGNNRLLGQSPALMRHRQWQSLTPFVPTRYMKTHKDGRPKLDAAGLAIGSAEHDLRRLLAAQNYPEPVSIAMLEQAPLGGRPLRWVEFGTRRHEGAGSRGPIHGTGFVITFPEPIEGPLLLGYGAHFGLGMFVPVEG